MIGAASSGLYQIAEAELHQNIDKMKDIVRVFESVKCCIDMG